MENYLEKINSLVSEAMQAARDEGEKEALAKYNSVLEEYKTTSATDYAKKVQDITAYYDSKLKEADADYAKKLEEAKKAAYSEGYEAGRAEQAVEPEPSVPDTPAEPEVPVFEPADVSATFNLENSAATAFLNCGYTDAIALSGTSKVNDYYKNVVEGSHPSWTEIDNPVILGETGDKVYLTLNGVTKEYEGNTPIHNLIPQSIYACEIKRDDVIVGVGNIRTEGYLRMLDLDDTNNQIVNARDLGGWKCEGGRVAYGKMLRSAYFPEGMKYDSESSRKLRDIGLTIEIDINNKYNHADCGWRELNYSFSSYEGLISHPGSMKSYMKTVLAEIEAGGCVLTHCYAGADRTGTLSAVILLMLGVSAANVVIDYEMTSLSCWYNFMRINENGLRKFFKALSKLTGTTYQEKITWWLTKKVGLTASEIERFKKVLIVSEYANEEEEAEAKTIKPLTVVARDDDFAEVGNATYNNGDVESDKLYAVQLC